MKILGIDPGPETFGNVIFDTEKMNVFYCCENETHPFMFDDVNVVAIEEFQARGMPIGHESVKTIFNSGRLFEYFEYFSRHTSIAVKMITRSQVKLELCGTTRAKDANVNLAVRDYIAKWHRIPENKVKGTKKEPGPCHGVKSHSWAALAVALTYFIQSTKRGRNDLDRR